MQKLPAAATDQRRQQRGRRHRAVRPRAKLPRPKARCNRERDRLHTLCWLHHDSAKRVPVVEDSHVGINGINGDITTGMSSIRLAA